jgi:pyruvate formate lyase activating enzyme
LVLLRDNSKESQSRREALLYKKLGRGNVQCNLCPRRCIILTDKAGYCGVRQNVEGKLYTLIYGKVSSINIDPIEKKPLFHFHPGSLALSLGTIGCNMRCIHCQNWQISHVIPVKGFADHKVYNIVEEIPTDYVSPEAMVEMAHKYKCSGIAWTYNEPTIWLEYTLDGAKLAKQKGLYTAYVSNGYITPEALDTIGPYLDAFRIDVKGFTGQFYRKLAQVSNWETILEAAERAKKKWNMHVEIITLVIPKWNDDEEQLRSIADWIVDALGDETPWHVTRFMPHLELGHIPPTPIPTLERARQIGMDAGLKYVYIGNVLGHSGEHTYCKTCQKLLIERVGYEITKFNVTDEGKCRFCSADVNLRL